MQMAEGGERRVLRTRNLHLSKHIRPVVPTVTAEHSPFRTCFPYAKGAHLRSARDRTETAHGPCDPWVQRPHSRSGLARQPASDARGSAGAEVALSRLPPLHEAAKICATFATGSAESQEMRVGRARLLRQGGRVQRRGAARFCFAPLNRETKERRGASISTVRARSQASGLHMRIACAGRSRN